MVYGKRQMHIEQRIMCDVQRVRQLTQPVTDSCSGFRTGSAAGAEQHKRREDEQNSHSLEYTVGQAVMTTCARSGENGNQKDCSPQESILDSERAAAWVC